MSSQLLCWPRKERLHSQFNRLFPLGVKVVGDIIEAQNQRILEFAKARQLLRIPPNYGFIWQQLHNNIDVKSFTSTNIRAIVG